MAGSGEPTGLDIAYDELKDAYGRLRDQEARLNTQATFIMRKCCASRYS